jgi:hypothetical protein
MDKAKCKNYPEIVKKIQFYHRITKIAINFRFSILDPVNDGQHLSGRGIFWQKPPGGRLVVLY